MSKHAKICLVLPVLASVGVLWLNRPHPTSAQSEISPPPHNPDCRH